MKHLINTPVSDAKCTNHRLVLIFNDEPAWSNDILTENCSKHDSPLLCAASMFDTLTVKMRHHDTGDRAKWLRTARWLVSRCSYDGVRQANKKAPPVSDRVGTNCATNYPDQDLYSIR